jgi:CheY-like chemotaxis protein
MDFLMSEPTILIVDDEEKILSSLRRLFRPQKYRILLAEGGPQALALIEAGERPAVVISDQRMPDMDGTTFLTHCRRLLPDAIRLMLTGYSDIQSAIAAINHGGIYRYLLKPWDDEELLQVVEEALSHFALIEENQRLTGEFEDKNAALKDLNTGLEDKVEERTRALRQTYQKNLDLTAQLERKVKELEGRDRIQQHLLSIHPLDETLSTVIEVITQVLQADSVIIHLCEDTLLPVRAGQSAGGFLSAEAVDALRFRIPHSQVVQRVLERNQTLNFKGGQLTLDGKSYTVGPFAAVPIPKGQEVLGVVEVHRQDFPLDDVGIETLTGFALQAAVAVSDSRLQAGIPQWESDLDDVLDQLDPGA